MNKSNQQGSAHVILISVLVLVILGLVGVLFWQNVIDNPSGNTNNDAVAKDEQQETKDETAESPEPSVSPLVATKAGIGEAMNTPDYDGLADLMVNSVDSAISHSDGIFTDQKPEVVVKALNQYFKDYASNNNTSSVTKWTFNEFKKIDNKKLKTQAEQTTFFDFNGSYVGVGESSPDDAFVAFRLNSQGKITYVFYGYILGY